MIILSRGKPTERRARFHQMANDWISADSIPDGKPLILGPTQVRLETPEEIALVEGETSTGMFWSLYELDRSTGRFSKRKRKRT